MHFSLFIIFVWTKLRIVLSICVTSCYSKFNTAEELWITESLKKRATLEHLENEVVKGEVFIHFYALIIELIAVDFKIKD